MKNNETRHQIIMYRKNCIEVVETQKALVGTVYDVGLNGHYIGSFFSMHGAGLAVTQVCDDIDEGRNPYSAPERN